MNKKCIYVLAMGVVYLSPWCFQSPTEQLKLLETGTAVTMQSYMAYLKDLTGLLANPGLHQSVRPDVAMLTQMLAYFKIRHIESALNKFIIRRYIYIFFKIIILKNLLIRYLFCFIIDISWEL